MQTGASVPDLACELQFPLHLPLTVQSFGEDCAAESLNISSTSSLFRIAKSIPTGSSIEFTISMPGNLLQAPTDILVRCSGRVSHCSAVVEGYELDVLIDDYCFKR
jgi:hypothetical protein